MYCDVANRERGVKEMFQICRLDLNLASSKYIYMFIQASRLILVGCLTSVQQQVG